MRTKIALLLIFLRQFFPALLLVNAACCQIAYLYGFSVLKMLLFFKLLSSAVIFYLVRKFRPITLFYYRNLGLTAAQLWTLALLADVLLLGLLLKITFKLR